MFTTLKWKYWKYCKRITGNRRSCWLLAAGCWMLDAFGASTARASMEITHRRVLVLFRDGVLWLLCLTGK